MKEKKKIKGRQQTDRDSSRREQKRCREEQRRGRWEGKLFPTRKEAVLRTWPVAQFLR